MAANWRRCQQCRKVLPVEDFDGDSPVCRVDVAKNEAPPPATSRTRAQPVTTRKAAPAPAATPQVAIRDIRGRGDHEVRARRARGRALDRLAEMHADDFAMLLREERVSEGL